MKSNGGFLISRIKSISSRQFEKLLSDSGIAEFNGAQGRILYVLWQEDHLPIVELSRRTGLAKNTLTSMLDRMEAAGHIRRIPAPSDRRQTLIVLTEQARALDKKYNEVSEIATQRFYKGFTEEEILQFESTLERVLHNLEQEE